MSKKVLVVGGAGYIGGCLTDKLIDHGYEVTVYDNLLYEDYYFKEVPFAFGDVRDTAKLVKLQKDFDTIIWLAALVGDGACAQDPALTHEINTAAVENFLNATKRRIIFPSTCSVYGAQDGILNEDSPTKPLSVYADTKLAAEKAVLKHGGLAFRLGTLFGLGDLFSRLRLDLVVNVLTFKALQERQITVFGGDQWRPIIAVRDVAEYFVEAVESDKVGVYNLGKENVRIKDLAPIYKECFPDLKVNIVDSKFEDLRNYQVSTQRALDNFKFRPKIIVAEEVGRMLTLLSEHRIKNPFDPIYYNAQFVRDALSSIKDITQPRINLGEL